ncbi:MAG TPA: hypothetical protein VG266_01845 [Candidatus Dormibacteraeota bacterium]|jgi:hypothetical protein|nr:hypothetical protein [Candidatus Dormibacteraeota bacterium]
MAMLDQQVGDPLAALRASWQSAAAAGALAAPDLEGFLMQRLDGLVESAQVDEASLIDVVDEVLVDLAHVGSDLGPEVARRLMRSIYEYLLALDAAASLNDPFRTAETTTSHPPRAAAAERRPADASPQVPVPPPPATTGATTAQVDALLDAGEYAAVATLLMRLTYGSGVTGIAHLAVAAGDSCRAGGDERAAGDCYLAASTSDPLDDLPLWRLASLSVERGDTELALSYLERIAALARWQGDPRKVEVVYRKMSVIAPEREDVVATLRRIQETGRVD